MLSGRYEFGFYVENSNVTMPKITEYWNEGVTYGAKWIWRIHVPGHQLA